MSARRFNPPTPSQSVPERISNYQARAVMRRTFLKDGSGTSLFSAVDSALRGAADAVAGLPDTNPTKIEYLTALDAWDQGSVVLRHGTMTTSLQGQFGFTDAETDALFVAGAAITA